MLMLLVGWGGREGIESMRKKAREPENIKLVASKIADFAEPLPEGFRWRSGVELPLSKSLTIERKNPFMIITINSEQAITTNIAQLDSSLEIGSKLGRDMMTQKWTKKSDGTSSVAGHSMKYELGEITMGEHHVGELRGAVPLKGKTVTIDAFGEWDKPFDMDRLNNFLAGIKLLK